jgi:hypothetical protein
MGDARHALGDAWHVPARPGCFLARPGTSRHALGASLRVLTRPGRRLSRPRWHLPDAAGRRRRAPHPVPAPAFKVDGHAFAVGMCPAVPCTRAGELTQHSPLNIVTKILTTPAKGNVGDTLAAETSTVHNFSPGCPFETIFFLIWDVFWRTTIISCCIKHWSPGS